MCVGGGGIEGVGVDGGLDGGLDGGYKGVKGAVDGEGGDRRGVDMVRPEWNSFPVALRCHVTEPAVPMQGCESATSTQKTGPRLI